MNPEAKRLIETNYAKTIVKRWQKMEAEYQDYTCDAFPDQLPWNKVDLHILTTVANFLVRASDELMEELCKLREEHPDYDVKGMATLGMALTVAATRLAFIGVREHGETRVIDFGPGKVGIPYGSPPPPTNGSNPT